MGIKRKIFLRFLKYLLFILFFSFVNLRLTLNPKPALAQIPTCVKSQGDANCDGKTNMIDFESWRKEYLGGTGTKTADFNNDSRVDMVDFEIWRKGFFAPPPTPWGDNPNITPTPKKWGTPIPITPGGATVRVGVPSPTSRYDVRATPTPIPGQQATVRVGVPSPTPTLNCTGCWKNGHCYSSNDSNCGTGGVTCRDCYSEGKQCYNGQCTTFYTCPNGCWEGKICKLGTSNIACGSGGGFCHNCRDAGQVCVNKSCKTIQ